MKLLIIGIDAGDKRIASYFNMPFLQQKIYENNKTKKLRIDLISRGWAEILTGEHASKTGALYIRPKLDGTRTFSVHIDRHALEANSAVECIWSRLNKLGISFGMMNVPTTSPAAKIDGFWVAGGGGDYAKGLVGIPDNFYYPREIKEILQSKNYLIDTHIKNIHTSDVKVFLKKLLEMTNKRIESFLALYKKFKVDVGFIVFRSLSQLQYLVMSEIDSMINKDCDLSGRWKNELIEFYYQFDKILKRLFDDLAPDNYIIVSDHGIAPYKYNINVDEFLVKFNFIKSSFSIKQSIKKVGKLILKRNSLMSYLYNPRGYIKDYTNSLAFGHWYMQGIYLNDRERFDGPVKKNDIDYVTKDICDAFNSDPIAAKYKLKAMSYRSRFNSTFSKYLPDIKINSPDSFFFIGGYSPFIEKNKNYGPISDIEHINQGMYSGIKSSQPLFLINQKLNDFIVKNDPDDLTIVNKIIFRLFS